jgi:hypothetical protein
MGGAMEHAGMAGLSGRWAGVVDLLARRGGRMEDGDRTSGGFAGLSSLRAYWEALRGDAIAPERAQIDPRGIESALPIAFLAEEIAPGIARLRVAGGQLGRLMGMEVRGMPISALIAPDSRDDFAGVLRRVFAQPAIAEIALRGAPGLTQPRLEGRMLLLPLRANDGKISRLLGGIALQGRVGLAPRRLTLVGMQLTPLGTTAEAKAEEPGFADPPAPFAPAPPRGRPVLRVISNDDDAD